MIKEHHWDLLREHANEKIAAVSLKAAELEKQSEQLRKDTAEANARAEEARLELQRLRIPRMVDPKKFNAELAAAQPPSNVEVLYVEECSDCFIVASMIRALLKDARWPASIAPLSKLQSGPDWLLGLPAVIQHRANVTGISIVTSQVGDFDGKSTASALVRAIMRSVDGAQGQWSSDETMPSDAVRVVVAPKL